MLKTMKNKALVGLASIAIIGGLVAGMVSGTNLASNANAGTVVSDKAKKVAFILGVKEYFVNDATPGTPMDVAPMIESDRTYVPVRFLGNSIGIGDENIKWAPDTQKVTLTNGQTTVQLVIGQTGVLVNGKQVPNEVAPIIRSDRTMLPARFVAEPFGYKVDWDGDFGAAMFTASGESKPDLTKLAGYLATKGIVIGKPVNTVPTNPNAPAEVQALQNLYNLPTEQSGSEWYLTEPKKVGETNVGVSYDPEDKVYSVNIILPSTSRNGTATVDYTPIEKFLAWKYPNNPSNALVVEKAKHLGSTIFVWMEINGDRIKIDRPGGSMARITIFSN